MLPPTYKEVVSFAPQAKVNNATASAGYIDTQGFRYLEVSVIIGALDVALTTLKLQECDTSGGSYVDVVGTRVGTDNNDQAALSVLPTSASGNTIQKFEIDLRGRMRFIKPIVTVGNGSTGAYLAVVGKLWRGENTPTLPASKGATAVMRTPVI